MDSSDWDARYSAFTNERSAGPTPWVDEVVSSLIPGTALDLGAGDGRHTLWLARHGWSVTAVDFSATALQRLTDFAARELPSGAGSIVTVEDDVTRFRAAPGSHDLVLIAYLHLPEPTLREVVSAAATGLAPGGTLLIVGHDLSSAGQGVGGPQDADLLWTPERLRALVGTTSLTVVSTGRVTRLATTDDGEKQATDAVLIARRAADSSTPTDRRAKGPNVR